MDVGHFEYLLKTPLTKFTLPQQQNSIGPQFNSQTTRDIDSNVAEDLNAFGKFYDVLIEHFTDMENGLLLQSG